MRLIDADALKDKLQQHHDFYVMAWGGFGKMPIGEKKRVDEITNCIAEVVNAPTIEPKHGEWIDKGWKGDWQFETDGRGNCWYEYKCSECGYIKRGGKSNYCPNCGAKMKGVKDE